MHHPATVVAGRPLRFGDGPKHEKSSSNDDTTAVERATLPAGGLAAIPDSRLSGRPRLVQLEYALYITFLTVVMSFGAYRVYLQGWEPSVLANQRLKPAWVLPAVFGGVDMQDYQLLKVIDYAPLLYGGLAIYVCMSRLLRAFGGPGVHATGLLLVNCAALYHLHGPPIIWALAIMVTNFLWSKLHRRLPFAVYYTVPWIYHIGVLYANAKYEGYRFHWIADDLEWVDAMGRGLMRWHVAFNMSTLRMLAYLYDVREAHERGDALRVEQEAKHATCADCVEFKAPCYRLRTASPRPLAEYNVVTYLAYITYVPLYIGGPLSSFNAFASHLQSAQRSFDATKIARYAVRTLCIFLCLIALLHVNHVLAIRATPGHFVAMPLGDKLFFGLQFLAFLWLKFNYIWKSFRIFAILDGFEVPENMNRCFANTTLVAEFWRDWHASFNQWIVRYMYVPLGGNKRKGIAIIPIFFFIAIWHDVELHLLWWAGIIVCAFIPELLVGAMFAKHFAWVRTKPYYRHVAAAGGVGTTLALIVSNLFGFGTEMKSGDGVAALFANAGAIAMTVMMLFASNNVGLLERALRREAELRRRALLGLTPTTEA